MRIISGKARGCKLYTLEGTATRPTLDRVKEPLFSIIQSRIPNALILDLFAGSGALGLEALSRGAEKAILCDNSKKAINIIKQNVEKTKFEEQTSVLNIDYAKALQDFREQKIKFNIIFLDPPYRENLLLSAIEKIIEYNLLENDGIIVAETDENIDSVKIVNNSENIDVNENIYARISKIANIYDTRKYGRVKLLFIKK